MQISGVLSMDSSVEGIDLRVHIEYRKDQAADIEILKLQALRQAMKVLQHEVSVSQSRASAKSLRW